MSKKGIALCVLMISLFIFDVAIWGNILYVKFYYNYKPVPIDEIEWEPPQKMETGSKLYITETLNNHFNLKYNYKEDKLFEKGIWGNTSLITRTITIDENLSEWNFILVLTHELCHLKYYTANETFTEYITFVELYESGNDLFKNRAEWMIYEQCVRQIYRGTNYDCAYYIINYLKEKNLLQII